MIDVSTKKHGTGFMAKMLAGFGGAHQFNVTLAKNHDNGELILRGNWNSIDNYDEDVAGTITFAGVIREAAAEGGYYVEATADTDALFVYNTPINPYAEKEFNDPALYFNEAGSVVRAAQIKKGDIMTISENLFSGKVVPGKAVSFADGKYVVAK